MTQDADTRDLDIHVTVIDDDAMFRESLCRNLRSSGFRVTDFDSGESGLEFLLGDEQTDLIVLDWKMPGLNGLDVLQRIREAKIEVPVIFLTVLTDQIYEESALLHGAVDFVEKSRSFAIVMKRIELILGGSKGGARDQSEADVRVRIGDLDLRRDMHRVYWKQQEVPLTLNEFLMVDHLVGCRGKNVRYRDLYDVIHGKGFAAGAGAEGYRANVRAFIKRIREKFKALDPDFTDIENFPGYGYRWRQGEDDGG